jgi:tetratricopeptide (TPR) repeat protein
MTAVPERAEDLHARLTRFPVARYPAQHATTQFHLGSGRLAAGDVPGALEALAVARDVFGRVGMGLEEAKAGVMLGIALRAVGRSGEAAEILAAAADAFAELGRPVEEGAARYNLGLVLADAGDRAGAHVCWERAHRLFVEGRQPAQAAAAAREHGASLLTAGEVAAAIRVLDRAAEEADRAGDAVGLGAAVNVLGLAHLADGDVPAATAAFRRALAAHPRSVRPGEYAMVKANLALAAARGGDAVRARLAARQALAVAGAAGPVRAQAADVLAGLPPADDVVAVLDTEPRDRWPAVLREEVLRLAEASPAERDATVRVFLDGLLDRPEVAHALAESLLSMVLELPPRSYDGLVASVVHGCAGRPVAQSDRLRAVLESTMARFAIPQWQRLAASLNAAAVASGQPAGWR